MPKSIFVHANEAKASLVEGPRLSTKQPLGSATVAIAVVGDYKSEGDANSPLNKHDRFLALLSTDNHPETSNPSNETDEQLEKRIEDENRWTSRPRRYCNRYKKVLRDWNLARRYKNSMHFCDTDGKCSHGPALSLYPGNGFWSFRWGEDDFDHAMKAGLRRSDVEMPAPDVKDADRALESLGDMLKKAVEAGLTDLRVGVSATDDTTVQTVDRGLVELRALNSRALDAVIGWVEEGWVARDRLDISWRPFDTTRRFGVLGAQDTPSFMIFDEK